MSFSAQILKPSAQSYKIARDALENGGIVAIPTETVYGLAANATSESAIEKIYKAKNRPMNNPLIVHVGSKFKTVRALVDKGWVAPEVLHTPLEKTANALMLSCWPGPLTMVLPKGPKLPAMVSAGLNTIGFRMPNHTCFLTLLDSIDYPLAAPSANRSNSISPTTADHVAKEIGDAIPFILDGGSCNVGVESTIIKILENGKAVVLRVGGLPLSQLKQYIDINDKLISEPKVLLAPGMQKTHYAPKTPLVLLTAIFDYEDLYRFLNQLEKPTKRLGILALNSLLQEGCVQLPAAITQSYSITTHDLAKGDHEGVSVARDLYGAMRSLDESDLDVILVDTCPSKEGLWAAINDRLLRASTNIADQ